MPSRTRWTSQWGSVIRGLALYSMCPVAPPRVTRMAPTQTAKGQMHLPGCTASDTASLINSRAASFLTPTCAEGFPDRLDSSFHPFLDHRHASTTKGMLIPSAIGRSQALRPSICRQSYLLLHNRSQSTFEGETRYWQNIAPWKHVSVDQFISYRWQVRALCGNARGSPTSTSG